MCQLPIGVLLDKFGVKRVGRVGIFLWSVASFAAAVTPSLGGLFAARFLLGVGEAPTFPANAKAVGLWFPPQERSLATSLFDAAAKFGFGHRRAHHRRCVALRRMALELRAYWSPLARLSSLTSGAFTRIPRTTLS